MLSLFSDLVAAISAALHETFVRSKYAITVFLSFCYIYKYFARQLKVLPPSFCHFCACEMSPGSGHLITWMDPSVGHLNGILARVGGNLNNNFQKSQMPGGAHVEASIWPIHKADCKPVMFAEIHLSVQHSLKRHQTFGATYCQRSKHRSPNATFDDECLSNWSKT